MTVLCLVGSLDLLIALSVLCALLLLGVCTVSALLVIDRKKRSNILKTDVYMRGSDDKTVVCAEKAENCDVNESKNAGENGGESDDKACNEKSEADGL